MRDGLLLWVSLPYATYGLTVDCWEVVEAPPIARWMVGKPVLEVTDWLYRRDAIVKVVG